MLYMVELDFSDPGREADWNVWYGEHLSVLLAMPGFRTAQRFKAEGPAKSSYLAMYEIDSPAVFTSEAYRARGGRGSPGKWTALMVDWHRNLFEGIERTPAVPLDAILLVVDRATPSDPELPDGLLRLRCVGLDRTVYERGMAVRPPEEARALFAGELTGNTRVFRPLMPQVRT